LSKPLRISLPAVELNGVYAGLSSALYFTDEGNVRDVAQTDIGIIIFRHTILDVFVESPQDGLTSTPPPLSLLLPVT
jgi:hypothetical protein